MLILALVLVAASSDGALVVGGDVFIASPRTAERVRTLEPGTVGVVNYEGSVCEDVVGGALAGGRWRLCASPEAPAQLERWGAGVVVHDNNHRGDGGARGQLEVRADLERSGFVVVAYSRPACIGEEGRRICVLAWHDAEPKALSAVVDAVRAHHADRVVVVVHKSRRPNGRPLQTEALVSAGADVVVGVGGHRPGRVERVGSALVLHDLGDLVVDCACSGSEAGLLAKIPTTPGAPIRLRVVRVAHDSDDVVGASPPPADVERVLQQILGGSPGLGGMLVDDELVIPSPG